MGPPKRPLFVDTSGWLAWLVRGDPHHSKARGLVHRIQAGEYPHLYTSEDVLGETVSVASRKYSVSVARETLRRIQQEPSVAVLYTDEAVLQRSLDVYLNLSRPDIPFVDVCICGHMERNAIRDVFTFDKEHFDFLRKAFDVSRVPR